MTDRPPLPPFDLEAALTKVQAAEDPWNTRDPVRVAGAYTTDSAWRNRDTFINGRQEIIEFLTAKWARELDYALRKSLWGFRENRIAVRFQYECHDASGQWWRSYGNELWDKRHYFSGGMSSKVWQPSAKTRSGTVLGEIVSQLHEAREFYSRAQVAALG